LTSHASSGQGDGRALAAMVAFLCLVWGSTWLAIKIGLRDMPPFFAAGLRFLGASAILFALSRLQGVPGPRTRRQHAGLVALGFGVFALNYGVVYWAEQYLPAGVTAVLFAIHPLLVSLFAAWALPDEALSAGKLAGIALGFAGVAVLFLDDVSLSGPHALFAAAMLLLAPTASAVSNVALKKHAGDLHPYTIATLPMLYGGATMFAVSAFIEDWHRVHWTQSSVAALAYLTVFGSVLTFIVYYTLLKRVAISRLALISYLFPVVAVFISWLILGERLGPRGWIGSALVVLGVALAGVRRRPSVPVETGQA
jgi:drug/metabolite transporter (DMT)-like permease